MSIRHLSLVELRALAAQKLGPRAAELKTRDEIEAALEKLERKRAPKKVVEPPKNPPSEVEGQRPALPSQPLEAPPIGPIPQITVETPTADFFVDPDLPRLPGSYADDRVLTFARDPSTLYAAWDFAPERRPTGGVVVNAAGDPIRAFPIGTAVGGVFLEQLPSGIALKVEVRVDDTTVGESGWVTMPLPPKSLDRSDASSPS